MKTRIAFLGFRHNHILELYAKASRHPDIQITAVCEEDGGTRARLEKERGIRFTHICSRRLLRETDADAVAVGACFHHRGQLVIDSLERNLHVISDKPICTAGRDWDRIGSLALARKRSVICMLDLRDQGNFAAFRNLVLEGRIGRVTSAFFGGQHPLKPDKRPPWYFEDGKHGGTLNDLAVHGFDLLSWITGLEFSRVQAARAWNAGHSPFRGFQEGAQVMAELENGAGVLGDVSYFLPDNHAVGCPLYWRITIWGTMGVAETSFGQECVEAWLKDRQGVVRFPSLPHAPGGYLDDFLAEIKGRALPRGLSTRACLTASRWALLAQMMADQTSIHSGGDPMVLAMPG